MGIVGRLALYSTEFILIHLYNIFLFSVGCDVRSRKVQLSQCLFN
jgi:hypothetical protein